MREWLKTEAGILAALAMLGGLTLWSHGELRKDIRQAVGPEGEIAVLRSEIAAIRERLARIEGHLGTQPQTTQ